MSEHIFVFSILLMLGTVVVIFGMKYLSAAWQARSRAASEDAYRDLARKAVEAESANATTLSSIQSELSDIGSRLAAVAKILKEVE